jgi:hypothetical protein
MNKEKQIEDEIVTKAEMLDFVILLENAMTKDNECIKQDIVDILTDFKIRFKQEARKETLIGVQKIIDEKLEKWYEKWMRKIVTGRCLIELKELKQSLKELGEK